MRLRTSSDEPQIGIGLKQEIFRLSRIAAQKLLAHRDGLAVFLLFEKRAAKPQLPIERFRLEHHRQPIGALGRHVLLGHRVRITQQTVSHAVVDAQFDALGQRLDRRVELALADADEAEVLIRALEGRELRDGRLITGDSVGQPVLLKMDVGQREIEDRAGGGLDRLLEQRNGFSRSSLPRHQLHDLLHDLFFDHGDARLDLGACAVRAHERLLECGVLPKRRGLIDPFIGQPTRGGQRGQNGQFRCRSHRFLLRIKPTAQT